MQRMSRGDVGVGREPGLSLSGNGDRIYGDRSMSPRAAWLEQGPLPPRICPSELNNNPQQSAKSAVEIMNTNKQDFPNPRVCRTQRYSRIRVKHAKLYATVRVDSSKSQLKGICLLDIRFTTCAFHVDLNADDTYAASPTSLVELSGV